MKQRSVAVVTGASQGIGRSTAVRLAKDYSAVVLVARNGDALAEVESTVRAAGAEPLSIALDLSRAEPRRRFSKRRSTVTAAWTRFSISPERCPRLISSR